MAAIPKQSRSFLLRRPVLAALAVVVTAVIGAILFGSAGRLNLPFFWAYLGVVGATTMTAYLIVDQDLIRERARPGPGGRDRLTAHVGRLALLSHLLLAGLDAGRWHVGDTVPVALRIVGLGALGGGFCLSFWAMVINPFFSSIVRLQTERGHRVITDGPYRWIRHPGYAGAFVTMVASPLALGSWVSAAPMALFLPFMVRRLLIEDRFLRANLAGYTAYATDVRRRLLPGLW